MAAIPAYNEAASIERIVAGARQRVDEVVVVDDGSSDSTARLAGKAGATVLRHSVNQGKAAAIMTAFSTATERGVDAIVLLDGDGQHSPDDIPQLLEPLLAGQADVVVGSRFLGIRNPIPRYRVVGQRVLNVATHLGSGLPCSDSQCGYRAFNRHAFTSMRLRETFLHGLAVESEMQFEMADRRLRLREVPIYVTYDHKPRRSPIAHGCSVLFRVGVMTVERRRALAVGVPAGMFGALGALTMLLI
jgi:glycosyltransferase involved in cell wall biosynthesis